MEAIRIPLPVLWSMLRAAVFAFLHWLERGGCSIVWFANFRSGRRRSFSLMRLLPVRPVPVWRILEKTPQYLKFCQFADQVAADPALAKSVEGRDRYDFQKPNTRSKAYKVALACL